MSGGRDIDDDVLLAVKESIDARHAMLISRVRLSVKTINLPSLKPL
jgi:hypothetical protein